MNLHILPLAIAMMAGPQLLSSIVLITADRPIKPSAAYVCAIALATATGIALAMLFFTFIDRHASLHHGGHKSTTAKAIELVLVGVLIALSARTFAKRKDIKPPKWMAALQTMPPGKTFKLGIGLIVMMPTDLVILITCGLDLVSNHHSFVDALPFIGLVTLLAGLPLLGYLLFRRRAEVIMPGVRDWIQHNAWAVNISIYLLFIYLMLS